MTEKWHAYMRMGGTNAFIIIFICWRHKSTKGSVNLIYTNRREWESMWWENENKRRKIRKKKRNLICLYLLLLLLFVYVLIYFAFTECALEWADILKLYTTVSHVQSQSRCNASSNRRCFTTTTTMILRLYH